MVAEKLTGLGQHARHLDNTNGVARAVDVGRKCQSRSVGRNSEGSRAALMVVCSLIAIGPTWSAAQQDGRQAVVLPAGVATVSDKGQADAPAPVVQGDPGGRAPQRADQAPSWPREAAERGGAEAQIRFGELYFKGDGVPKAVAQAAVWYHRAAAQGNAEAQAILAAMYYSGEGVPKDAGKAAFWTRKAAEQGNAVAQSSLGLKYLYGEGVPEDHGQAASWYRKAAEQGRAEAQVMLAAMYSVGIGVPTDGVQAYAWLYLALAQGADAQGVDAQWAELAATELARLERTMTPAQIAEGRRLSHELVD